MSNNEDKKVILFLGIHLDVDDAKEAILKIKEKTEHIPNKDKFLLIECTGWAFGTNGLPNFTGQFNDKELGEKFFKINEFYDKCIKKIKENKTLFGEELH